jgi:hypothetical protein
MHALYLCVQAASDPSDPVMPFQSRLILEGDRIILHSVSEGNHICVHVCRPHQISTVRLPSSWTWVDHVLFPCSRRHACMRGNSLRFLNNTHTCLQAPSDPSDPNSALAKQLDLGRSLRLWLQLQGSVNTLYDSSTSENNAGGIQVRMFTMHLNHTAAWNTLM